MSLAARQHAIVEEFSRLSDWEARYKHLIEIGKALPELPENMRAEDFKIRGCQSQVWMHAQMTDGKIHFRADSDAILVRGLVALLLRLYSDASPQEILATPPDFIREIGLESKLSPSRANGLLAMVKQMKFYALAFQARGG